MDAKEIASTIKNYKNASKNYKKNPTEARLEVLNESFESLRKSLEHGDLAIVVGITEYLNEEN